MKKVFLVLVFGFLLILSISVVSSQSNQQASFNLSNASEPYYNSYHSKNVSWLTPQKCLNLENEGFEEGDYVEVNVTSGNDADALSGVWQVNSIPESLISKDGCSKSSNFLSIDVRDTNYDGDDWHSASNNFHVNGTVSLVQNVPSLDNTKPANSCLSENYVLNKSVGGNSFKQYSCLANYSSDSRCYAGACRTCVDYDSKDAVSGNFFDKGITWNASHDFETRGGLEDQCLNSTHLTEYSCDSSTLTGGNIEGNIVNCENLPNKNVEYRCEEGACVCDPELDWKFDSCSSDHKGTLVDAKCQILDPEEVLCDYENTGVVGNAVPFDSVKIDGEEFDNSKNYTNTGVKDVRIEKDGASIEFKWDTEDTEGTPNEIEEELVLENISFDVSSQSGDKGYALVEGLDEKKTVFVDRVAGTDKICIKDEEISSIDEISSDCSGSNEVMIKCPGSSGNYNCDFVNGGSDYKVWPLKSSGVIEIDSSSNFNTQNNPSPNNNQNNGSNGSSPNNQNNNNQNNNSNQQTGQNTCKEEDWDCSTWNECSEGEKERVCSKKLNTNCVGGYTPEETSTEGCDSEEETENTTNQSDGLPTWALALIIAGGCLIIAIVVFFIVANRK